MAPTVAHVLELLKPVQAVFLDEAQDELHFVRAQQPLFPHEPNRTACGALSRRLQLLLQWHRRR